MSMNRDPIQKLTKTILHIKNVIKRFLSRIDETSFE
jgi:hypothetical protein